MNRTLLCLNLANNAVGDAGAQRLADVSSASGSHTTYGNTSVGCVTQKTMGVEQPHCSLTCAAKAALDASGGE